MRAPKALVIIVLCIIFIGCSSDGGVNVEPTNNPNPEGLYFPPISTNEWESVTAAQLGWNESNVPDLLNYLDQKNTKGFIVLKNGRIVIEEYFNGHSQNDVWFWNSASKSLTATAVGIAQDEGHLNIDNKTSDYLGTNWSTLSTEKEDLITVKHHLSMTTGLDDKIDQPIAWTCTLRTCLDYESDAGTRWAYHQGAYLKLFDIVAEATNVDFSDYVAEKIETKIGMDGNWKQQGFLSRYETNTRDMARFGLLMMNQGIWNHDVILSKTYFESMTNSTQDINNSYGYLWWLNGKTSYMGVSSQEVFDGSLIPNAPAEMFSALGANDQKIYVVPSRNLVIVRSGESANESQLGPSSFDNELWEKINAVID